MANKTKRLSFSDNVLSIGPLRLRRLGFVPSHDPNIVRGYAEIEKCLALGKAGKIKGGKRH
jgi:hypothetical protein